MSKPSLREDPVALPTTFYLGGLDAYVRGNVKCFQAYFASQAAPLPLTRPGTEAALNEHVLDISEALMLGDGVALSVTGENTVLAYLVRMFGARATVELMQRGTIEFVGEASAPGFGLDPSQVKQADGSPLPPGQPLMMQFVYSQAEPTTYDARGLNGRASAEMALRRYRDVLNLDRREVRELTRRAAKRTHVEPMNRVQVIQSRIASAYAAGELEPLGLSPSIAQDTSTYQDRDLSALASRVQRVENLLDFELDQYMMPDEWVDIHRFTEDATSVRACCAWSTASSNCAGRQIYARCSRITSSVLPTSHACACIPRRKGSGGGYGKTRTRETPSKSQKTSCVNWPASINLLRKSTSHVSQASRPSSSRKTRC